MKTIITIIISFSMIGCIADTHLNISKAKYKAIEILNDSGIYVKDTSPEIVIVETKKEMKELINDFAGVYKYNSGFYCPGNDTIYLYKRCNNKVISHEYMHYYLLRACPGLPVKLHHAVIHQLGY